MSAEDELNKIAGEVASCTKCNLHHSRKNAVPGEGPPNADIMLIGEGPGFHENEQGRPFVGAAGRFLEELLGSIDLQLEVKGFLCLHRMLVSLRQSSAVPRRILVQVLIGTRWWA